MNFIVYLVLGLIPWFFMNEVILGDVSAIKMNEPIVKGITFPVSILPTVEVTAIFIKRFFTFSFSFIILLVFESVSNFNILLFLYYFISMYLLMCAYNLVLSAFVAVSKNFSQLYETITRVLMFFLPILWSFDYVNNKSVAVALKMVPFSYIVIGFRDAFILNNAPSLIYSIYFWAVVLILFAIGSVVQHKFIRFYSDII